jgi:hypothetical protein
MAIKNIIMLSLAERNLGEVMFYSPNIEDHYMLGEKHRLQQEEYKRINEEIKTLNESLANAKDSKEYNDIKTRIQKLQRQLRTMEDYKHFRSIDVGRDEIERKLLDPNLTDKEKSFDVAEYEWPSGAGQNFTSQNERVIVSFLSDETINSLQRDPVLKKFIDSKLKIGHFAKDKVPMGWAIIYVKDPKTWVINQMQSDIFPLLNKAVRERKGLSVSDSKITPEEIKIRLRSTGREGYLQLPYINMILQALSAQPDAITELPMADNARDAEEAIQEHMRYQQDILSKGLISLNFESDYRANPNATYNEMQTAKTLPNLELQELEYIKDKLGWLSEEWPDIVFHNVWLKAKREGVVDLYMNTSSSVTGGANEAKLRSIYEVRPKKWGFTRKKVNFRPLRKDIIWDSDPKNESHQKEVSIGGEEELWYRKAKKINGVNLIK